MISINEYIKAKQVITDYEAQDLKNGVVWMCSKDLYMENKEEGMAFTKGKEYKQGDSISPSAIDDLGHLHTFGSWEHHFKKVQTKD